MQDFSLDQFDPKHIWLAGLGALIVVAAVTTFMPIVVVLAMLALLLPGIAMIAGTALLPYYALAVAVGFLTRGWTRMIALAVSLTVIGITPPLIVNHDLIAQGKALSAGDHSHALPRNRRAIAFLLPARAVANSYEDPEAGCGQYCQRLLYTGEANAVLVGASRPNAGTPDPKMLVTRYHVEQRAECPPADLRNADSGWPDWAGPRTTDMVMLAIANGRCLIRDMVPLSAAHIIVRDGPLALSAPGDTHARPLITAQRLEIFGMARARPVEFVRRTQVQIRPLMTPWLWTRDFYSGLESEMGFIRRNQTLSSYDLTDSLHEAGLKMAMPQEVKIASDQWPLRHRLSEGLADPKAVAGDPRLALAGEYLKAIAELGPVDTQDAAVVAKVAGDARIADSQRVYLKKALEKLGK